MKSCRSSFDSLLLGNTETSHLPNRIIGTQGLCKKIVQKGLSWQTPIPGDEVEVHYSVVLEDGDYVDSSRDKGTPFRFKLGQSEVIKGWDEGIATMRKGERAIFRIPPKLAYGEIGSPPLVPPNSTLIFDVEIITWYPIRDISGDGGIMKKITREGEGWATPNDVDDVLVKYIVKDETGSIFSRSDEGLEFSLADGHPCLAMSRTVKTMRKGETVELNVKSPYGFRNFRNGTSDVEEAMIPTNQNLIIYLELVSWKSVVDICSDGKILKKIIKIGEGFDRPNEGSLVKVIYSCNLKDGTIFEKKGSDEEPFEYTLEEEKVYGLDRAIMTMKKGEEAAVRINSDSLDGSKAGYTTSLIPVSYEIKLVDFSKEKPFWKMKNQERLEAVKRVKDEGNVLFKAGKFLLAAKKYEKASRFMDYNHSFAEELKVEANSLQLMCYLNNAACKLKTGEYREVIKLCAKVLEIDFSNVKALFRRTEAYLRLSDLDKADADIRRALAIDPNNKEVKIKQRELRDRQMKFVQQEAKFFGTMISKMTNDMKVQ